MHCIETTSESRPNRVTYHGTPAAGMNTPRPNAGSSSRSDSRSRTAWSHARATDTFAVVRPTVGRWAGAVSITDEPVARIVAPGSGRAVGIVSMWQGNAVGRRPEPEIGNHLMHVCQVPFGG